MPEHAHILQTNSTRKESNSRWIALLLGHLGLGAAFFWGFAEGTLFFIIPDVLLTLTALFSLKKALLQVVATTSGALLAGLVMFSWSSRDYHGASKAVMSVPYVSESMKTVVHQHFDEYSTIESLLRGSFSGIPYKLYAIEAPSYTGLSSLILATVPARSARFLCVVMLSAAIGHWLRTHIRKNPMPTLAGHGIFWVILYAAYWSSV